MKCQEIVELLPLHVYGDVTGDEQAQIVAHLEQCAACRTEAEAYSTARRQLTQASPSTAAVDLAAIYRDENRRHLRRARWWQRLTWAAVAVAAAVLLSRCEIDVREQSLSVRWGGFNTERVHDSVVIVQPRPASEPAAADQVRILQELVHALAAMIATQDRDRQGELNTFRGELARLQKKIEAIYAETRHDVSALYAAQFGATRKESIP